MQLMAIAFMAAALFSPGGRLLPVAREGCRAIYVHEDAKQLFMADDERVGVPLLSDERGIRHPRWSPDGTLIAYANDFRLRENDVVSEIVVRRVSDLSTQRIPLSLEDGVKDVSQLGWRDEHTLWIEGHVNPRAAVYYEWDVRSGRRTRETLGTSFAYSPDRTHLAYIAHDPAPGSTAPSALMLDGEPVYRITGGKLRGPIQWSPSGEEIAFARVMEGNVTPMVVTRRGEERSSSVSWLNDETSRRVVTETLDSKGNRVRTFVVEDLHCR